MTPPTTAPSFSSSQRRTLLSGLLACALATKLASAKAQNIISVGPGKAIRSIAAAAAIAKDGDVIEVQAGDYVGDIAVWTKNDLTLRAVGGRVRLIASGMAAQGKAIWVMRGERVSVEGFDFSGAQVPDRNGAGIRLEAGQLTVKDCSFQKNQNGILTNNEPQAELSIINCEFGYNGHGDGQSHNMYVGAIAKLSITGSYSHHAKVGHLLKSRAAVNHVFYNRFSDEIGGSASYELEFSNGGVAVVVGNIVQQGSQTQNPHLISYGVEGYKWPRNELHLINNTLVDDRPNSGVFLRVSPGSVKVKAVNNLLVGRATLDAAGPGDYRNNFNVDWEQFEQASREDYRLRAGSKLLGKAVDAGSAGAQALMPDSEYQHPHTLTRLKGRALHPGALQSLK